MPQYTITEPHPTVAANAYTHSGRGGAGNMFRAGATTAPAGIPSRAPAPAQASTRFYSGRGGAGNAHASAQRTTLSFEDEYAAAASRDKSQALGHVGRGGAGNVFSSGADKADSSRRDSASTGGSVRSGFWGRLSGQH